MISAALSPMMRAVLYVFAATLDGIMDMSRISKTHGEGIEPATFKAVVP
jgi:hypothetical protein